MDLKEIDGLLDLCDVMYEQINSVQITYKKIRSRLENMQRNALRERKEVRLMRLTEDVGLQKEYHYHNCPSGEVKTYKAGQLIDCIINGVVYLDDDGDGFLYFPRNKLEQVTLSLDDLSVPWDTVIRQG